MIRPCPQCGGARVPTDFEIGGQGSHWPRVVQKARKFQWLKTKPNSSGVVTLTCIQCGYITWYASHPNVLISDK